MKLKAAKIGDTVYVFDEQSEARVKRENILPDGHAANFFDKTSEWLIDEPIIDTTKTGSAQYVWDKSGNRVKCQRCRYRKDASGTVTQTVERTVFKTF